MADRERFPPALAPFLQLPPEHTQTLITSVLGASASWLIVQCLASLLGANQPDVRANQDADGNPKGGTAVVLVSWMRQWNFWRTESRRSVGLDLQQLYQNGRFIYIDGLSDLLVPTPSQSTRATRSELDSSPTSGVGESAIPTADQAQQHPLVLNNPTLEYMHQIISQAIAKVKARSSSNVVLVLDTPNILLQTTKPPVDALQLNRALLQLRMQVHSVLLSLPADDAFLAPAAALDVQDPGIISGVTTPLDADNAAFITGMAHQSHTIMQCRRLETGWAEDVSGVLRITAGSDNYEEENDIPRGDSQTGEGEWLYLVGIEGSVKVWSRGTNA